MNTFCRKQQFQGTSYWMGIKEMRSGAAQGSCCKAASNITRSGADKMCDARDLTSLNLLSRACAIYGNSNTGVLGNLNPPKKKDRTLS